MDTKDRELSITRVLNAPRELVFETWTNPEHIKQWWGPDGFKTTIQEMDVRQGGKWRLILHGPDGTDYRNESVYLEVVKPEKVVIDHISGPKFQMTTTFVEQGNKTLLTIQMLFETAEELERTIKQFGADEGLKQNVNKLEAYLETITN